MEKVDSFISVGNPQPCLRTPIVWLHFLQALMATHPTLPELYQQHCKQLKLKPDPSVMRMLEKGINDIFALDLSTLVFSPYAFEAVMEVCRILPHLGRSFEGSQWNARVWGDGHIWKG